MEKLGWQFRPRDKVIQTENDYDKDVFNGDIGQIVKIDAVEREVTIRFDQREVVYDFGELDEISLAYAITIHKSQRVIDSGYDRGVYKVVSLSELPSSSDYPKLLKLVKERGCEHQVVSAGDKLRWDDALEVEVLSRPKNF